MEHRVWRVRPTSRSEAEQLASSAGIDPTTAQLLLHRGVRSAQEAKRFLGPSLEGLTDPHTLPDLTRATARIRRAIDRRESIFVFGDSDVDGLTASVMLYEALRGMGARVRARQSNRITEGYGMPEALVRSLCRSTVSLLLVVDCGTNQPEAIRELAEHGIETIIVDHHIPLEGWAKPYALVNPFADPTGACRELSSAGLAFKLLEALLEQERHERLEAFLDLAALGLLADYAPLLGDARILVARGLERIVRSARHGLRRLCEATQILQPDPEQLVRRLVPRLNASGRLGDASAIWKLLLSERDDQVEGWLLASEEAHATTKQLHRQIVREAYEQVNRINFRDQYVLVVSRSGWHQGLMGPLASQLAQHYGRPTIAIAMDEQQGIGSGRSIPLFNLLEALRACQGLLVRFGGHAQACGLTVGRQHLESFRALVNQQARLSLGREGLVKTELADLELSLGDMQPRWVEETERFAPFGNGNPRPTVIIRRLTIDARSPRTATVSDGIARMLARGRALDGLAGGNFDVMATPACEEGSVVLTVRDVKASPAPS